MSHKPSDGHELSPMLPIEDDDEPSLIDQIAARGVLAPVEQRSLAFASGRAVVIEPGEPDQLTVRSPQGNVELSIRFTPDGPVLSFSAAAIQLSSAGDMSLDCGKLRVRARDGIELKSDGDLLSEVAGRAEVEAHAVAIRSRRGDVEITANDDVRIDGERVLLNS